MYKKRQRPVISWTLSVPFLASSLLDCRLSRTYWPTWRVSSFARATLQGRDTQSVCKISATASTSSDKVPLLIRMIFEQSSNLPPSNSGLLLRRHFGYRKHWQILLIHIQAIKFSKNVCAASQHHQAARQHDRFQFSRRGEDLTASWTCHWR